ncbi:MAG TPA: pseudouridine synthase [Patescibacteria group bacterium]|nr:pseudouridine synthase [Patescibacteria group bacterium]
MRINRFVATATGLSRRAADKVIKSGQVIIDDKVATLGQEVDIDSIVSLNNQILSLPQAALIMLNKPAGYVVSREGQGSQTIYSLLPQNLASLKPVGRLDKDSSGLLLLTNDGQLAQILTHPKYQKTKVYRIVLGKDLAAGDQRKIESGVNLDDGVSWFQLEGDKNNWIATIGEGRNRQIRRTFSKLGYTVTRLHRIKFGPFELSNLQSGHYIHLPTDVIL